MHALMHIACMRTLMRIMNFFGVRLARWKRPAHLNRMSTSSKFKSSHLQSHRSCITSWKEE